jgi:hypothetical protein
VSDDGKWVEVPLEWGTHTDLQKGRVRQCGNCGAIITATTIVQHQNFHKTFTHRKDGGMSKVLWCDPGDHPFKADAPGSATLQGSQVDDNGMRQEVTQDVCVTHNPYASQTAKDNAVRAQLTAAAETELNRL